MSHPAPATNDHRRAPIAGAPRMVRVGASKVWAALLLCGGLTGCISELQVVGDTANLVCPEGSGLTACAGLCVNLNSDARFCGACDTTCMAGEECSQGACVPRCTATCDAVLEVCNGSSCACRPGFTRCGDTCVDTQSSPDHCNSCSDSCGGELCLNGTCVDASACVASDTATNATITLCGVNCVDVRWHPAHCGECDRPCAADESCLNGDCYRIVSSPCTDDSKCADGERCCNDPFVDHRVCIQGNECP